LRPAAEKATLHSKNAPQRCLPQDITTTTRIVVLQIGIHRTILYSGREISDPDENFQFWQTNFLGESISTLPWQHQNNTNFCTLFRPV
jgi:hypothetical protein